MEDQKVVEQGIAEAFQKGIQDEVRIVLEKAAGVAVFKRSIEASSAAAALNGIAVLVVEYAKQIEVPVESVLSILTTVLLAPAAKEGLKQ